MIARLQAGSPDKTVVSGAEEGKNRKAP